MEITGFSFDEVHGTPILDLIEEKYKESVKDVLENALQEKNTVNYQQELVTKDGDRVTLILNATARISGGLVTGVIGVAQDITEMLRLQRKGIWNLRWVVKKIIVRSLIYLMKDIYGNMN